MSELMYIFRILIAGMCGLVIGYERKNRSKEAGIRTHFIVACAASLMMIISKYGFYDLIKMAALDGVDVRLDPSRIASCIVSGVGFLGAGMIFVHKQTVKGLTTAAGIWATAGIGMAIGSGLYIVGIIFTLLIYCAQIILHSNSRFLASPQLRHLKIEGVDRTGYIKELSERLAEFNITIDEVDVLRNAEEQTFEYSITVETPDDIEEEDILSVIEFDASLEIIK
ncbi:MAG: MgtC/SapB family protein [Clostridia bacterium]|nr:MgtC/SapB family protein [Clostridia bacterium]